MSYELLTGIDEKECRRVFESVYCSKPIVTHDGIMVRFRKRNFDHAFFESVDDKDDTFSNARAERVHWIKDVLQDSGSEMRQGWDNKAKKSLRNRRVALVNEDYVVIIAIKKGLEADFVTAFVANPSTIEKIRKNPIWG